MEDATPIVRFTVQMDYDDYRCYYWFYFLRLRKKALCFMILAPIFALLSWFLIQSPYLTAIATGLGIAAVVRWIIFIPSPKRSYKKTSLDTTEIEYTFFEGHLEALVHEQDAEHQTTAQYSRYVSIEETPAYIYLRKTDENYVQLPKHCMTSDQNIALRDLFTRKFGEKFKPYHPKGK